MKELKLEKFQGPLDLLLQLVELEKMNISEVALSQVTEQFLKHLDTIEADRSEELADFLVIATRLVYLKSRTLLPYLYPDEDEGPSLADQLKMYQQYIEASRKINIFWQGNQVAYGRTEPPVRPGGFVMPGNAYPSDLLRSMTALVTRLRPLNPLPRATIDRAITVKQKLESIFNLLKAHKRVSFKSILADAANRTDVIVSFLALLELVKAEQAFVRQGGTFGDMEILKA